MRTSWTLLLALLLIGALAPLVGSLARAEEPAEGDEAEAKALDPEEAKRLEALLTKAAKRRKAEEVLPALDEVGERSHDSFQKPLLKMLTHDVEEVALRAADVLSFQKPESEKDREKLGKAIWKKAFGDRKNSRRPNVQARAALAAVSVEGGAELDRSRFQEVEKLWRSVVGDPQEANAPTIVSVCEYVQLSKDKRLCRLIAEEIDEPGATAVDSPTNPPAEWWERRWKMWKQYKAVVVETLEELTGESFKDTAGAKAWFEANEKEFGFHW